MILEYSLDYRSPSLVYEKIFLNHLKEFNLNGNISKNGFELKLFVEADKIEELEEFATNFANALPHSIFLYDTKVVVVDTMPTQKYEIEDIKLSSPPCPKCLKDIQKSSNPFIQCNVCGYLKDDIEVSLDNIETQIIETAQKIKDGKVIKINTFYGKYFIGLPNSIYNGLNFDILAYDLATIEKYANIEEYELNALASFEKPAIRLKKKLKFTMDYEDIEDELIRFRLSDDGILYVLMEKLHNIGVDMLSITKDNIDTTQELILTNIEDELDPLEVVVSKDNILIIDGNRGLVDRVKRDVNPQIVDFYSIIDEYNIKDRCSTIAGVNLNRDYCNIIVDGEKFGLIEYLSFGFEFNSMEDIFNKIKSTDEEGAKLINNYKKKYQSHYDKISTIKFDNNQLSIYQLWGIIAIILDFVDTKDILEGAKEIENNSLYFLGERGVRIDYKISNQDGKPKYNPLMTIRTAMSFRLAGVDKLGLSYGMIESFLEFITNELDGLKSSMNIDSVVISGTLLSNKRIFAKISDETNMNHNVYFGTKI